jgi:two-component system, NtrC family, sensor kinase
MSEPTGRRLGVRAQILLGLTLVTLFAVLSTGYLALWAGGSSLRIQRESTALALATAAAASTAAVIDADHPMSAQENRARLTAVGRDLTQGGEVTQVCFLATDRRVVLCQPGRMAGDTDPPVVLTVLGGIRPVFNYRTPPATGAGGSSDGRSEPGSDLGLGLAGPGGANPTELLAYAAVNVRNQVVGAVRVSIPAPAPTTVVLQRSGWVLLTLAAANALLVLALGYLVLTQLVVRPIRTVEKATALVTAGDWDQAITPSGPREVRALAAAFNQMTASLASQREQLIRTEKLASVGQLAAGVAHEIGNPLAAILGFVDILRSDAGEGAGALGPAERRDMLDRVKAETQRIHRTIQDLLAYSQPSREEPQPTDPLKIFKSSQGLLEPQKRFRGVLVVGAGVSAWPRVLVSPGRLQQVFVNLLINAADAMEGQGTVTVSCEAGDGKVSILFSDTGPGVAPELRRKIFDPFFTTKPPGQGTGLGLAISRSILESYGGSLDLAAEDARGTTFVITLPGVDA